MDVLGSSKITSKTLTLEETLKLIKCNAYLEYFLKHLAFVLLLNDGSAIQNTVQSGAILDIILYSDV